MKLKRGQFKAKGLGIFKRTRSDYRSVTREKGLFWDVMGGHYKTKKQAATQNAFIWGMGL